jgi:CRISPR/Cas system CSM-associated protein Csm3 (group 7 of RAMP superfamily)
MDKHTLKNLSVGEIKVIIAALYGLTIKGSEARSFISLVDNIEKQLDKIEFTPPPS